MSWLDDDRLDQELKRAFAREEPPADFAARTMARAQRGRGTMLPRWTVAAAASLLIAGAGYGYRWRQGEAAKDQLLLALRITASKVNQIQTQVTR